MDDIEEGLLRRPESSNGAAAGRSNPFGRLHWSGLSASCVLAEGTVTVEHQAQNKKTRNRLLIALVISALFLVVEFVGGIYAHSLAILTDAAHLLSDVSGFFVSALATIWVARASSRHFSYGFHRVEVLGALASVLTVWLVTGVLLVEAVERLRNPTYVDGKIMFILAVVGVGVNVLLLWLLGGHHHHPGGGGHSHSHSSPCGGGGGDHGHNGHKHSHNSSSSHHEHEHEEEAPDAEHHNHADYGNNHSHGEGGSCNSNSNINMRGAVIHVIGDLVQSVGVMVAGALIWYHQDDERWYIADPICTFLFAGLVLWTTMAIIRDISDILMERAPRGVDPDDIAEHISQIEGVCGVHDLHVWQLTPGIPLMAAHVEISEQADPTAVLHAINKYCKSLGIDHSTVQLVVDGAGGCPCGGDSRRGSGVMVPPVEE